jgi:hypothetical protein
MVRHVRAGCGIAKSNQAVLVVRLAAGRTKLHNEHCHAVRAAQEDRAEQEHRQMLIFYLGLTAAQLMVQFRAVPLHLLDDGA